MESRGKFSNFTENQDGTDSCFEPGQHQESQGQQHEGDTQRCLQESRQKFQWEAFGQGTSQAVMNHLFPHFF